MTMTNDPTTAEGRKMILPELSVPAGHDERVTEARQLVETLTPQMKHLGELVSQIREANDDCIRALDAAGVPTKFDDIHELVGDFTKWIPVWNEVSGMLDPLGADGISLSEIRASETARGGERDFPIDTEALVPLPDDSHLVRVRVVFLPREYKGEGWLYTVATTEDGTRFLCSHEEIKAGLAPVDA